VAQGPRAPFEKPWCKKSRSVNRKRVIESFAGSPPIADIRSSLLPTGGPGGPDLRQPPHPVHDGAHPGRLGAPEDDGGDHHQRGREPDPDARRQGTHPGPDERVPCLIQPLRPGERSIPSGWTASHPWASEGFLPGGFGHKGILPQKIFKGVKSVFSHSKLRKKTFC